MSTQQALLYIPTVLVVWGLVIWGAYWRDRARRAERQVTDKVKAQVETVHRTYGTVAVRSVSTTEQRELN